jgi:hypothetical protein
MSVVPLPTILSHRRAAPVASVAAGLLAVALVASLASAAKTRAELEARIADLSRQAQGVGAYWRARTAVCESQARSLANASGASGLALTGDGGAARTAAQLASRAPEGFDACARMESADAAVLGSLR